MHLTPPARSQQSADAVPGAVVLDRLRCIARSAIQQLELLLHLELAPIAQQL